MNISLRTPLNRRTLLRGAGATLALPFLECMMPRLGHAALPQPPSAQVLAKRSPFRP